MTENKQVSQVCIPCGNKHKTKEKSVFGMWKGECDMCGEETSVAAAGHDFGIYRDKTHELIEAMQDLI